MKKYLMVAESSTGKTIREIWIEADNEAEANKIMWNSLATFQQDQTAVIECVDVSRIAELVRSR